MMHGDAGAILRDLEAVANERRKRSLDDFVAVRVHAIKSFQQRRFEHTYADLLANERYAGAARFFLEDLYGPKDFTRRDTEFARVVPALVRVFPGEIVSTVAHIARLHALSESLDSAMGSNVSTPTVTWPIYVSAWQRTGRRDDRELQLELTLSVGQALERYTRSATLRTTLRMMRSPARAAGLGALQQFLESGFEAFRKMSGAAGFLATVEHRERHLTAKLFDTEADSPLLANEFP